MAGPAKTTSYQLEEISAAIEIGTKLTGHWFRGHPEVHGELTPSAFRKDLISRFPLPTTVADPARFVEKHFFEGFQLKAPSVSDDLPDGLLSWLFLMQHHGTPTRLLDWTENILVALYFAVRYPDKDGELWAMAPIALAGCSGMPGLPTQDNIALNYLAAEPALDAAALAHFMRGAAPPRIPLPILPPLKFRRMVAQSSTFTIHPLPSSGTSIPSTLTDKKYLVRYIIPAKAKKQLLDDLGALGINNFTLFPDLDGLSIYLREEYLRPLSKPQAPPAFRCRVSAVKRKNGRRSSQKVSNSRKKKPDKHEHHQ